jgi:hypothetical protein
MPIIPSISPEVLTSEERWRRWEQRGRDNDARFMRRARWVFWSTSIVFLVGILLLFLLQ